MRNEIYIVLLYFIRMAAKCARNWLEIKQRLFCIKHLTVLFDALIVIGNVFVSLIHGKKEGNKFNSGVFRQHLR